MTKPKKSILARMIHRIGPTGLGLRLGPRILRPLDTLLHRLSGGKITFTGAAQAPVVFVTTTGAKSGLPRTVPLVAIFDPERPGVFALIASNWGQKAFPGWYYNLRAHPQATCTLDGQEVRYTAREAEWEGEEYQRFWGYASELYAGYPEYRKRAGRRIPIIVMEPGE